jgi:hypothetical protein
MLHNINCSFRVNAQDPDYPTYVEVAATVHTNANDDNIFGVIVNGTTVITNYLTTASRNWQQGIRIKVTIDGVDVSKALTGAIDIRHDKNMISTFSLNLGDIQYVPISNSHIDLDKVVVITSYVNGQEKKLFTGLVDDIEVNNTPFNIAINGYDYGKKLLDTKDTIVSLQNLGESTKRSDAIKYLAEQGGITDVDIPDMSAITIDNSFSDQSIWDMIQKEAMVELYWVRFTEDGQMKLQLDNIKTDTTLYSTADWTYGENRFKRLDYKKSKDGIINKITVLGKTTQKRVPHTTTTIISGEDYNTPVTLFSDTVSIANGEHIDYNASLNYSKTVGDFTLKMHSYGSGPAGNIEIIVGCKTQNIWESYVITAKSETVGGDATLKSYTSSASVGGTVHMDGMTWNLFRDGNGGTNYTKGQDGYAFTFAVTVTGYLNREAAPTRYETDTTYETRYDQISATITDPNSIEKYGLKDGGSVEYPLLETVDQCEAVGSKIIRDSHQNLANANYAVPFNPLIIPGKTVQFKDSKIGLTTERYYVKSLSHNIIPSGDTETSVECVYYA